MNISELLGLQQLQGMPPSQAAPMYNPETPLDPHSMMMQQVQQSMMPYKEQTGLLPFLLNTASDIGTAGLRSSQSPMAQELGKIGRTTTERREAHEAKRPKAAEMLNFLQAAEMANRKGTAEEKRFNETKRHHQAVEGIQGAHYGTMTNKAKKELEALEKQEKFQEQFPGSKPLDLMTTAERTESTRELRQRANAPVKLGHALKNFEQVLTIVKNNPNLATSRTAFLNPEEEKGGWNTVKRYLSNKDDLKDVQKVKKLLASVNLDEMAKSFPKGSRPNMLLERLARMSTGSFDLEPEALENIFNGLKTEYDRFVKDADNIKKYAIPNGMYINEPIEEVPATSTVAPEFDANNPQMAAAVQSLISSKPELQGKDPAMIWKVWSDMNATK